MNKLALVLIVVTLSGCQGIADTLRRSEILAQVKSAVEVGASEMVPIVKEAVSVGLADGVGKATDKAVESIKEGKAIKSEDYTEILTGAGVVTLLAVIQGVRERMKRKKLKARISNGA